MAGQNPGELDAGKFPKEPDEGDEDVIDRNLAQQQAKQGQKAGGQGSGERSPAASEDGGTAGGTEGSMSEGQKSATIDSTKGLP